MKRIILSALLFAGAMSSCSKNEITEVLPMSDNANSIGLDLAASATRALESEANDIREAGNVDIDYYVYVAGGNTTDTDGTAVAAGTYGELKFEYVNGTWYQTGTAMMWSDLLGTDLDGEFYTYSMVLGNMGESTGSPVVSLVMSTGNDTASDAATGEYVTAATFTPETTIAKQYDVLYHSDAVTDLPTTGKISATFNHALSRIELYASCEGYTPYVKSIGLVGFKDSGAATIYADADEATANVEDQIAAYTTIAGTTIGENGTDYSPKSSTHKIAWSTASASTTAAAYYSWFDKTTETNNGSVATVYGQQLVNGCLITDEPDDTAVNANSFTSDDTTDAIIIPQIIESTHEDFVSYFETNIQTNGSGGTLVDDAKTVPTNYYGLNYKAEHAEHYVNTYAGFTGSSKGLYYETQLAYPSVYALYRMEDSSSNNSVGYLNYNNSPEFVKMTNSNNDEYQTVYPTSIFQSATTGADGIDVYTVNSNYENAALYVLVAFPFSPYLPGTDTTEGDDPISVIFEPGYDYDLYVGFGTTGGILLCDYYFFGDGTMTNIPIEGIDPGDTVLTTGDSEIGLTVLGTTWIDYDGGDNTSGGDESTNAENELLD